MTNHASATTAHPSGLMALPPGAPAAARTVFRLLGRLAVGTLDVQMPDGSQARFGRGIEGAPRAAA